MNAAGRGIQVAVGRAWWRFHAGRLFECACLGLAAGLATAAAAALSGAEPRATSALVVAALSALACGAAWWVEVRRTPAEVARRLDRGLGRDGALVTAYECAAREQQGALEQLLLEREASVLGSRAARRGIAPPSIAFAAAPLVLAALLSVALEAPVRRDASLFEVAGSGDALGSAAGPAAEGTRAESERAAAEGASRSSELAQAGTEPASESATQVPEVSVAGATPPTGAGAPATQLSEGGEAVAGEVESESSVSALANGEAGSTMGGSAPGAGDAMSTALPSSTLPGTPDAERGVLSGRWWPAEYDSIVRDWTASRTGDEPR